ncbi:hypothetical protein LWI28_016575 [Acer negundo]|uniref:Uncharacterized protein n=1 Tax=Acer negundo TaxID=4023 RepID=A0AAD5IMT3_ACENE|nr:hypothetical protein LWI28_016575 [Acer negundo]
MAALSPVEPVAKELGVCKDGVSLLAGNGSGAAGVSVGTHCCMCRVGEKPIRKEGLRKEREEKVWKEVRRKDSLEKGKDLTVVLAQDQGNIEFNKEKEFKSLGGENLQLAVTVEESEIVLNVSKDIVKGRLNGGCLVLNF